METDMAKATDQHAGSGIDKPDPKTLLEKVGDGLKSILPSKARGDTSVLDTGNGTIQRLSK
jgi:hypothetical protein